MILTSTIGGHLVVTFDNGARFRFAYGVNGPDLIEGPPNHYLYLNAQGGYSELRGAVTVEIQPAPLSPALQSSS